MKKVLKYDELNEYYNYTSLSEDEMLEMANVTDDITGINNVVIWVGPSPPYHWKRIKVSNKANYFLADDCFTITISDLKIIGDVNTKLITSKIMNNIIF